MQLRSTVSLSEGHTNLKNLILEVGEEPDFNEAATRLFIIDRILTDCLGWPKRPDAFKVEDALDGQYADYVLGEPEIVVWEAKKAGIYFDFPADSSKKAVQSIQEIIAVSKSAEAALRQVQGYCNDRGIEFAVACSGHQIIAFIAVRVGQAWLKGRALAIRSLAHLDAEFATVWQCLSPDGISEKRLVSLLEVGTTRAIPPKLSASLFRFPSIRYKSDLQTNLRTLGELLIEDVVTTETIKAKFYSECYCDTGALSRDSLVSEQILRARYAALFPASEDSPRLEAAAQPNADPALTNQILTEALARRPIVLLGDVGVGKTSFLEDLMYVRAPQEFERAITIYIDLGSKAALESDLRKFVIEEIERQLLEKYNVDINEQNFVRGVYDLEVKRFRSSFKAQIYKANKNKYEEQVAKQIEELLSNKPEHLRRSIEHVAKARLRQVVFMIDNADQREFAIQQSAFIISQELAQNWNALVFIAVRPQTFFQSKRSGALAAYPHKVFTIHPPRPELVIEKRLVFALKIAEGKISAAILQGVKLQIWSIALFLQALLFSLKHNRELTEILANITGGNIRAVVEFVTRFIGSPNVDAEKIVKFQQKEDYIIPIHEFSKAAILGDYSHYVPASSIAMNLFDVDSIDRREHFIGLMITSFLMAPNPLADRDGFFRSSTVVEEMQRWGFLPDQTTRALRRLTNKKLIETTERITFEEDLTGLVGDMPEGFRYTAVGAYHFRRWACTFSYIDGMAFDTPIFDPSTRDQMSKHLESFDILHRYERAISFRDYLTSTWDASNLRPSYFDWHEAVRAGDGTFLAVKRAAAKSVKTSS